MTPDELESLVKRGDSMAMARALESLCEAERKKLSKAAAGLLREIQRHRRDLWRNPADVQAALAGLKDTMKRILRGGSGSPGLDKKERAAQIAVLGLCPITNTRKVEARGDEKSAADVIKVLSDRRPDWIDEWLEERFKGEWPTTDWDVYWALYKSGACRRASSENYYRFMATQLNGWSALVRKRKKPLHEILAEAPELLEDIWKLFEVDTIAFAHDWGEQKDGINESFPTAILRLAEQGVLDRGRLLDASLAGLSTGFKQNLLSGYAGLHERLEPTEDELCARQSAYCDLLSQRVNQVVSFAVGMLKKIDQAKRLDDVTFVAEAPRVFDSPTKGPAKQVIVLFKKIGKRSAELQPRIGRILVEAALKHPNEDVALAAIELVGQWRERLDVATLRSLAEIVEELPAKIQAPAREILAGAVGSVLEQAAPVATEVDAGERLAELKATVVSLAPQWRRLAGVDEAIAAIEAGQPIGESPFALTDVPVLTGVRPVTPIASVDELIDAVAHALEKVESAMEVERILDGISRLCRERPADFERRTDPLIRRMQTARGSMTTHGLTTTWAAPAELDLLLGGWMADDAAAAGPPQGFVIPDVIQGLVSNRARDLEHTVTIGWFFALRLERLFERVRRRIASPLLGMPTHEGGWIDPVELVSRWRQMEAAGVAVDDVEVIQALLRLAPDRRSEALADTAELTDELVPALRWALGGVDGPGASDVKMRDVWLAAGRARACRAPLDELGSSAYFAPGPDGIEPARYEFRFRFNEPGSQYAMERYQDRLLNVERTPPVESGSALVTRPTLLLHVNSRWHAYQVAAPWYFEWIRCIWPLNADPYLALGATSLAVRIDQNSSTMEPNFQFVYPLLDVDRPWTEPARMVACLALGGRDQDARVLAIDALHEAIADGRVHPRSLGETLARFAPPDYLKLNRVCPALADVARASALHAEVVAEVLETFLAAFDDLPSDAHHLLSLLQDLLLQLGGELGAPAREVIARVKGGGKSAKLGAALLKLNAAPTVAAHEARLQLLDARIRRAERWQGATTPS